MVDHFTKAAELEFLAGQQAMTVARAFHNSWLMRYGLPSWITSDNGSEFPDALRHQHERFGVEHVTPPFVILNQTVRLSVLVATVRSILAAKVAGAVHDWPVLLPQIRTEYMQRMQSATGYSPIRMVFCIAPRLPPPMRALRWEARAAFVGAAASASVPPTSDFTPDACLASRDETAQSLLSIAFDRILARQKNHAAQQRARRAGRRKGRKPLQVGDLACLLTRTGGFKPDAHGPFVVAALSDTKRSQFAQQVLLHARSQRHLRCT
jgi:hypothetical protein